MIMTSRAEKLLHPFFTSEHHERSQIHVAPDSDKSSRASQDLAYDASPSGRIALGSRDCRTQEEADDGTNNTRKAMNQAVLPFAKIHNVARPSPAASLEVDPNAERRKRRKTTPPSKIGEPKQYWSEISRIEKADDPVAEMQQPELPSIFTTQSTDQQQQQQQQQEHMPFKKLKLNGQGGLGSPQKVVKTEAAKTNKGRPRKPAAATKKASSLLVVLKYGVHSNEQKSSVGQRIESILSGNSSKETTTPDVYPSVVQATHPGKSTHPFFLGTSQANSKDMSRSEGIGAREEPASRPADIKTFSTPGKLQAASRDQHRSRSPLSKHHEGTFKMTKKSSGAYPPLTWKEVVAANKDQSSDKAFGSCSSPRGAQPRPHQRRLKHKHESSPSIDNMLQSYLALTRIARQLTNAQIGENVRKPHRSTLTGDAITTIIRDKIFDSSLRHPAIKSLLKSLPGRVSAFDDGECEKLLWTSKYAPTRAEDVIQTGKEVEVLKIWLNSLTISSVKQRLDTASTLAQNSSIKKLSLHKTHKPRKRARKSFCDDLDDFIVSGDEDDTEMQELEDLDASSQLGHKSYQPSVVRRNCYSASIQDKTNTVLLSGPHGSCKTAAAYAVAKELGFEVFEINSASRRSKQDIFERVGDMINNHQVRREGVVSSGTEDSPEVDVITESAANDQQSLKSFFGPKPTKSRKAGQRSKANSETSAPKQSKSTARQQQKQSLILIEEADILYADDKQFWEAILELAIKSKRPIILTCNDENVLPIDQLSLHAILRFKPPPGDLACDYLLITAAAEGHLLDKASLQKLYAACNFDLRSAMSQLNFWCQMAVGDEKGGLEWYPVRWPPGADIDANGNRKRVISIGTVLDAFGDPPCSELVPDRQLLDIDPHLRLSDLGLTQTLHPCDLWAEAAPGSVIDLEGGKTAERNSLACHLDAICCLSDIATFANIDVPADPVAYEKIDTSHPDLSRKERNDFTIAHPLLDVQLEHDCTDLSSRLAFSTSAFIAAISGQSLHPDETSDASATKLHNTIAQNARVSTASTKIVPFKLLFTPLEPLTIDYENESCIDANSISTIAVEIAPYIRSIAKFDRELEREIEAIVGDKAKNKPRTTRAALSALGGNARSSQRRKEWWPKIPGLSLDQILQTGGRNWSTEMRIGVEDEL